MPSGPQRGALLTYDREDRCQPEARLHGPPELNGPPSSGNDRGRKAQREYDGTGPWGNGELGSKASTGVVWTVLTIRLSSVRRF